MIASVNCEGRAERVERIESTDIRIVSYRVGAQFHCAVDDLGSEITIAKTESVSRNGAESAAVSKAREVLVERLTQIPITADDGISRWEGEGGPAAL